MTFIPSSPEKLHQEATQGGTAVSESLLATVGATSNFILDNFIFYPFGVFGGVYSGLTVPFTFTGNMETVLFKSVIEKIVVFNEISGTLGTTSFRIEKQLAAGGAWTSIFSVNGSIANTSADNLSFESTDLVAPAGVVLPVLSITTLEKNDKLRFVLVTSATGGQNLSVKVITRPVA